jgi:alpha-glucosidase
MGSWWQSGVIYQVYLRSFADADGDGMGDLAGVTARLGYLRRLGVDALWLSPFYRSPMADMGYDITDHCDVDPLFGTLADFDALVSRAHQLDLRVLLDFVPNHTSDRHPWFERARASREAPHRDWYLWADPRSGGPPNNWRSVFGGSAWTHDPETGQSYYHAYLSSQPDLNWRNPEVRAAMLEVLRFWLRRGADGFRIDALRQLVKDAELRDNPPNPDWKPGMPSYEGLLPLRTTEQPESHEAIRAIRALLDEDGHGDGRLLVGEVWAPVERLVAYYGSALDGLHLPANFNLISTPWRGIAVAALIQAYEAVLAPGAWPNWVLGNHDRARVASRLGPAQARVAAMLLLTLRGTPTLYYGDEVGMENAAIPPERIVDPVGANIPGLAGGRDAVRTPMQWDTSPNAGFCPPGVTPWLPVADGAPVAAQRGDPDSTLELYHRLLALRRAEPALSLGSYTTVSATDETLVYLRENGSSRFAVALNLTADTHSVQVPTGRLVVSTARTDVSAVSRELLLKPDEGVVVRCR